jgi:hypothetical protein
LTLRILELSVLNRLQATIDIRSHNLGDKRVAGNIDKQHWDLNKSCINFNYQPEQHNILDCKDHNAGSTVIVTLRKKCYTKRCLRLEILIPVC